MPKRFVHNLRATTNIWEPRQNKDITIEAADRAAVALPNSIIRQMSISAYNVNSTQEPERYAAVEKSGFRIDRNVDIWSILCGKQGGHYVDVGTSKKIGDGLVSPNRLWKDRRLQG